MGMLIRRHREAAADIDMEQSEVMNTENVDVQEEEPLTEDAQADEDVQANQVKTTKKQVRRPRPMNKYTEKVITLAEDLTGCPDVAAFETSIDFISEVVERSILNDINQAEVPVELERVVTYRILGELIKLQGKNILGDADDMAKSIEIGDTKIEFNGEPLSVRLTALADVLTNYGKGELACYRRLKW